MTDRAIRTTFASTITKAIISGDPPEWREALECLDGHPMSHAKTSLDTLVTIHSHLVVLLTRYHLKKRGKFMNVKLIAAANEYWESLQ